MNEALLAALREYIKAECLYHVTESECAARGYDVSAMAEKRVAEQAWQRVLMIGKVVP